MTAKQKIIWSDYQKKIFVEIAKGTGNLIIIARAGASKSTVLVEGAKYIPRGKKSLFAAFNKSIQMELKDKLGSYVSECLTLHSLGLRAVKSRFGQNVEIDKNKCWSIVSDLVGGEKNNFDLIAAIDKTVALCKARLIDTPTKIDELIAEFDIDFEIEPDQFIKYVCQTLRLCKEKTNAVDFNDMIWFCFVYGIKPTQVDMLLLDEAQDMSRGQLELAISAVKPGGRIIAVLDDRQVLYGFAGVELNVLDYLRHRLQPKELMLPICYRCPMKVVYLAQKYVPDIKAYDLAIEGEINYIKLEDLEKHVVPGSFILSRINAPLIRICLRLLKQNIKANILGRDVGDGLQFLIKKSKKKTVPQFLEWLNKWEKSEKERLLLRNPKSNVEYIADKVECLYNLCEGCSSLEEIKSNIDKMFKDVDSKDVVMLSSIHRIKGRQQNNVFILESTLRYGSISEENVNYVGITRTQQKLYFVK